MYFQPKSYRQLTDRSPTVDRQSAEKRPTVGRQSVDKLSADCWLFVGRLLVACRPTVGRLSADCWPFVGRLLADCRSTVGRQSVWGALLQNYPKHYGPTPLKWNTAIHITHQSLLPITYLQLKLFWDAKIEFLVYWTFYIQREIFGFHTHITHKLVGFTAQVFQMELNHKPKTMQEILNDGIVNLLLIEM